MDRGEKGRADGASALVEVARFSGHGLTLALSMGLFLALGWWADGWLGTRPLLTIVGALTGAGAGFYYLLQHLLFLPRRREEDARREQEAPERDGDAEGERRADP